MHFNVFSVGQGVYPEYPTYFNAIFRLGQESNDNCIS